MDPVRLDAAISHAGTMPRLLSLLVVRRGRLVAEEYFNGSHADSLNDVRSVTKSVVSTLAGIAERRGELRIDETIAEHLSPWSSHIDEAEASIQVRHLLTMSGGWTWDESTTAAYNEWVLSSDPVAYVLQRAHAAQPGTTFRYNSGETHVLSVVVQDAVGRDLSAFAAEHLFAPLGIRRVRWEVFPDGRVNGGAGLDLRARDLAKLGQLWLQGGDAGATRILQPGWLDDGTRPAFPYWQAGPPLGRQSYGFLWWLSDSPGPRAFFAWGHGGQFIWVVPSLDLVVVVTHEWRGAGSQAGLLAVNGLDLIVNRVVRAVR
jgi:CubicO group peptidase (beta-lactamase class C family)